MNGAERVSSLSADAHRKAPVSFAFATELMGATRYSHSLFLSMHFCRGESSTSALGGELGVPEPPSALPPELLLVLELPELSAMFNRSKLQSYNTQPTLVFRVINM
jgi:hypothetical protein